MIALVLAALVLQESSVRSKEADDARARATVERPGAAQLKVSLDGAVLYEGPGTKAALDVIEIERLPSRRFVTVAVDGEEQVRVVAVSLARPAKLASAKPIEDPFLRVVTEEQQMTIQLVTRGGSSTEIFRGAKSLGKPELLARSEFVEVRLGDAIIYRARRAASGPKKSGTVADFVERINLHRKAAGLPEVRARADLTRACDLHALYLSKNAGREEVKGLRAHREEPGLAGYTEEGARAGGASVIHFFAARRELTWAVDGLMASLYHRVQLLEPRLAETGVGWAFDPEGIGVVVIHTGTATGPARDEPVVYPGPDQKDVPLEFALGGRETPDPVPDARAQGGYPITVQFPWSPAEAGVRLLLDGAEVEGWLSTPQSPARGDFPQPRTVCFIPKKPLEAGRTYAVEARARRGAEAWSKAWGFATKR